MAKQGARVWCGKALRGARAAFCAAMLASAPVLASAADGNFTCPNDYPVREGLNLDFPVDGAKRAFIVIPPAKNDSPAPVWVPMTGTVEATNDNLYVPRSGMNA